MSVQAEIHVWANPRALARAAAERIVTRAQESMAAHGHFTIALSGGETPLATYALLASDVDMREGMPWAHTHVFWGDERTVPPDHADSNYRAAWETLLSKVPVLSQNVHRIHGEMTPSNAADAYEARLRDCYALDTGEYPRFDLILLGFGADGHTASLFPGTKALAEQYAWVLPNWVARLYSTRITLTAPVLNNAAEVLFLVSGAEKALALKGALEGPYEPEQLPAQLVQPADGRLLYYLDRAAASQISSALITGQSDAER